jgi:hypothetical protein
MVAELEALRLEKVNKAIDANVEWWVKHHVNITGDKTCGHVAN